MDGLPPLPPHRKEGRNHYLDDGGTAGRLEGIGNAMLDHVINIDNLISSTLEMMATAISRIAENSEYLKHLETIDEGIMDLRRGVK